MSKRELEKHSSAAPNGAGTRKGSRSFFEFTLVEAYGAWLTSTGVCSNTLSFYLRTLRAAYNKAVERRVYQITIYLMRPFFHFVGMEILQAAIFWEFLLNIRFCTYKIMVKPVIWFCFLQSPPSMAFLAIVEHIFFILKAMAKKAKSILTLSKMAEPFVCHAVFHLSEDGFRFYTPPSPVSDSLF